MTASHQHISNLTVDMKLRTWCTYLQKKMITPEGEVHIHEENFIATDFGINSNVDGHKSYISYELIFRFTPTSGKALSVSNF